jgi:hypothetical protein
LLTRLTALADRDRPAGAARARLELLTERDTGWPADRFGLAEAAEIARQARLTLGHARPVRAEDLGTPAAPAPVGVAADELAARLTAALAELDDTRLALAEATLGDDADALVEALLRADALGVSGTVPLPETVLTPVAPNPDDAAAVAAAAEQAAARLAALRQQAQAAAAELEGRAAAVARLPGDDVAARLAAVFGPWFTVVPVLGPYPALVADVLGTGAAGGATPAAVRAWVQRAAGVREPVAALDGLHGYAETVALTDAGRAPPTAHVGQLGGPPGERWVALPPAAGSAVPGGRVGLVAYTAGDALPAEKDGVAGLLVDEWVEVVPASEETTSVSFHLDAPSSEPPQVMLLAVPPVNHDTWTPQEVLDVVTEALALARIRLVDSVPALGQVLPAFLASENTEGEAAALGVDALTEPEA